MPNYYKKKSKDRRKRSISAPIVGVSSSRSSSQDPSQPTEIPGFYYDPEKKKYFALIRGRKPTTAPSSPQPARYQISSALSRVSPLKFVKQLEIGSLNIGRCYNSSYQSCFGYM
eukprot:Sdes_comp18991_c1_seq1m9531